MTIRRTDAGFSLVATMVAVAIVTIGLLAMAKAQSTLMRSQALTAERSTALAIARSHTEALRSRDPWTVATEPATAVDSRGTPDPAGSYVRTVDVREQAADLIRVAVRVTDTRLTVPVEVETLIYRGVTE